MIDTVRNHIDEIMLMWAILFLFFYVSGTSGEIQDQTAELTKNANTTRLNKTWGLIKSSFK